MEKVEGKLGKCWNGEGGDVEKMTEEKEDEGGDGEYIRICEGSHPLCFTPNTLLQERKENSRAPKILFINGYVSKRLIWFM